MKKTAILISLAALTACQTTTNTPTSINLSAATGASGLAMTGTVLASANNTDAVTITIGGAALAGLARETSIDRGGFRAATMHGPIAGFVAVAHTGETTTGAMTASVVSTGKDVFGFQQAATFARTTGTAMPTSGTADYTGNYVGSFGNSTEQTFAVYGDASLSADFSAATISGAITNRNLVIGSGAEPATFNDIALGTATIDGTGAFSGITAGGSFPSHDGSGHTNVFGTWSGLIGGATGNQVAGAVQIAKEYHDLGVGAPAIMFETGVFLAE